MSQRGRRRPQGLQLVALDGSTGVLASLGCVFGSGAEVSVDAQTRGNVVGLVP